MTQHDLDGGGYCLMRIRSTCVLINLLVSKLWFPSIQIIDDL